MIDDEQERERRSGIREKIYEFFVNINNREKRDELLEEIDILGKK